MAPTRERERARVRVRVALESHQYLLNITTPTSTPEMKATRLSQRLRERGQNKEDHGKNHRIHGVSTLVGGR